MSRTTIVLRLVIAIVVVSVPVLVLPELVPQLFTRNDIFVEVFMAYIARAASATGGTFVVEAVDSQRFTLRYLFAQVIAAYASLVVAGWLVCSLSKTEASRDFRWMLSAAMAAGALTLAILWNSNIGEIDSLFYSVLAVPIGSLVTMGILEWRARRLRRGSACGVVIGIVSCLGAVLLLGPTNLPWLETEAYLVAVPAFCYGGYRLGRFVQLRIGVPKASRQAPRSSST